MQIDKWHFDVVRVKARKVDEYGKPFTATCDITITDGTPHVEGLIATKDLNSIDKKTIETYLKSIGYKHYEHSHFVNNERVVKRVEIKQ